LGLALIHPALKQKKLSPPVFGNVISAVGNKRANVLNRRSFHLDQINSHYPYPDIRFLIS